MENNKEGIELEYHINNNKLLHMVYMTNSNAIWIQSMIKVLLCCQFRVILYGAAMRLQRGCVNELTIIKTTNGVDIEMNWNPSNTFAKLSKGDIKPAEKYICMGKLQVNKKCIENSDEIVIG